MPISDGFSDAPDVLHKVLQARRTAALIADAELIRDAADGQERDDEARRAVRDVMLLSTLGKITRAERDRILDILSFAVTPMTPPSPPPRSDTDLDPFDTHGTLS